MALRTIAATRYVAPLREGGSLPAIVEADDQGMYVVKFRGAGQGPKALVAELVAGEIGRAAGLPVPDIVLMEIDGDLARTEPDPEIQDLIRASAGLNFALDYLPGAVSYDPVADRIDSRLASEIVCFDAYVSNVDRTARNTNLLIWHRRPHLIDHGAALYFHHAWDPALDSSRDPFAHVRNHVLLASADALPEAAEALRARLGAEVLRSIVESIPDAWLPAGDFGPPARQRDAYFDHLTRRLQPPLTFVEEAVRARSLLV